MVVRFFALIGIVLFIAGCSGGNDDAAKRRTPTPQLTPRTARATPVPTGPTASVQPPSGRPGVEITVNGKNFQAGATVTIAGVVPPGTQAPPYATVTTAADGTFAARFRLDKTATGGALNPGPFNLVVTSGPTHLNVIFDVNPPNSGSNGAGG